MKNQHRLILLSASATLLLSARYFPHSKVMPQRPAATAPLIFDLSMAPPPVGLRRAEAAQGMVAALLEEELSHIQGVIPRIADTPPSPALRDIPHPEDAEVWTGRLTLTDGTTLAAATLQVCAPDGACEQVPLLSGWHTVEPEIPRVVAAVAERMARPVLGAHHISAVSPDSYAELMTGRSAAIVYALREPVPADQLGDRRVDPLFRAPYLDPEMELAWWQQGRRLSGGPQLQAFERAAALAPSCPLHRANEAWARTQAERCTAAWESWEALTEDIDGTSADPRFWLPRAEAAICADELERAAALLERVGQPMHPTVARLQVKLSDAQGELPDHDERLARWQEADPDNAEPVRARIQLRLRSDRLDEAEALLPALETRGAAREAEELRLALAAEAHDWEQSLASAHDLQLPEQEARLRARIGMERGEPLPPDVALDTPLLSVTAAAQALSAGRLDEARARLDAVLEDNPYDTEALAVYEKLQRAAGDEQAAMQTHAELVWLDPRHAETR